jgi:signal transduction histidine kinase
VNNDAPSYEELSRKVATLEAALQRCERVAVASRFASALMHEVNNPLEAIGNLVYIAKLDREDPGSMLRYLEMIEEQMSVLSEITRRTLSFHRNQVEPRDGDLVQIAEAALKLYAGRIEKGLVTIHKRVPATAIATFVASEILQVLSNLILNALDALPVAGAHLSVRVHSSKTSLTITVADNGSGIAESVVPTLFQPFATGKQTGTGLGLWLSQGIVSKHKGSIRFRTCRRPGRSGTVYRVSLPIR